MRKTRYFMLGITALMLLLLSGTNRLRAQTITSSIVGRVTDISGAVVPAADVVVTNTGTGAIIRIQTNGVGQYIVSNLAPGIYTVRVTKTGFSPHLVQGMELLASSSIRADVVLRVGSISSAISVSARQAAINTEDATVGSVLQGKIIPALPVNGRTVDKFVRLAAGVSDGGHSGTNPRISGSAYWGGTQYSVDGIAYNDPGNGGASYSSQALNTMPPPDAIQEIEVNASNQLAQYAGAASVTVVTKSGTNQFHGSAYEFNRNKEFAAINPFSSKQPKPKFNRNEYGVVVTGPVIHNNLFFLGYLEQYAERSAIAISDSVEPQTLRSGDFSDPSLTTPGSPTYTIIRDPQTGKPFPNNVIPSNRLSSVAQTILKFVPLPNGPGVGPAGTDHNLILNVPNEFNVRRYGVKLDYLLGEKNHFTLSFFRSGSGTYKEATGYPPGYGSFSNSGFKTTSAEVSWIHLFSDHLVNEVHFATLEHMSIRLGVNNHFNPSSIIPGLYTPLPYGGIPEVRVNGFTAVGDYGGAMNNNHTYQIVDNVTLVKGKHTIKAGVDLVRDLVTRPENALGATFLTGSGNYAFGRFDFNGQYTNGGSGANSIQALADFLLGYPIATYRSTPAVRAAGVDPHYHFFAQDDWRVLPNLTLTYGLRYQLQEPWSTGGLISNYDPTLNELVVQGNDFPPQAQPRLIAAYPIVTSAQAGYHGGIFKRDNSDYSPRLGFAYRPYNNDRVVFRGGAGIYYDLFPFYTGPYHLAQNNAPFFLSETFSAAAGNKPSLSLDAPFPGNGALSKNPNVFGVARQMRNGRSIQWNLSVGNALTKNLSMRVSYVGNRTQHLMYNGANINLPNQQLPISRQDELPFQPWNGISFTYFDGDAYFNQLQVESIMRTHSGLNFQAEYNWTHSVDDVPVNGGPQNPFAPQADRGNSDSVLRQMFSLAYTYDLPFGRGQKFLNRGGILNEAIGGWQLTGIDVLDTGAPFSVSFNASGNGWLSTRANLVGDPRAVQNPGRHHWFNTAAFAVPPYLAYGNSPRNGVFGPGSVQVDAGVLKNFKISERATFQFRCEAFNALNHVNLANPSANVSVPSSFGIISGTSTDMREVQFAGKISF